MRKSIIFSLLLFGCLFFVRPSSASASDFFTTPDFSVLTVTSGNGSYSLESILNSSTDVFISYWNYPSIIGIYAYNFTKDVTFSYYSQTNAFAVNSVSFPSNSGTHSVYLLKENGLYSRLFNEPTAGQLPCNPMYKPIMPIKVTHANFVIDGNNVSPLPPIELNRELSNNFTISRYRFAGYASTNARFAISTDPAPSTNCDYFWSTTFMGPDLNQVLNMLNEFRHQDSEDLEQWLINHALDKSYRISNSVTYHHWTNEQMNTFDSRTGLFTIALPNSFIDAYDLSSVPAEDLADVQRIIYFSGYPVLVRMYYENRVTRERSPLTSVEYKPSVLAFWDYAGVSDFLPDPDDQGFSYTPGELVYDADLSVVTGVLYDVNYFSGWLANIVNAMPTKPLSLAFMTFIVTIIVGVVGVVLR